MTARRLRPEAGFTLTEMMIVVVIIGILSTMSFMFLNPKLDPDDLASQASTMAREAARRAATGGPVRNDVATALGTTARSRLHVSAASPLRTITVEVLQEDPLPSTSASWVQVLSFTVPVDVDLVGWRPTADLNGGSGPSVTLGAADEVEILCYPDARCDAATLYFQAHDPPHEQARTVLMPLGGSPALYRSW